ncbi:MAG: sulfotransferase domain-containing protein [Alphaproteobacteria bacterium]|nr:sulfotransferase domain-containing protein [Alphaproteobacteria bacterium]
MPSRYVAPIVPVPVPAGARFVMSYIKAGRTWLRFMLACYLADLHGLGVEVDLRSMFTIVPNNKDEPDRGLPAFAYRDRPGFPLVLCDHKLWEPFDPRRNPTVVMVRSPVDTLVSAYFMETRAAGHPELPVAAYLRKRIGVSRWATFHNSLVEMRGAPEVTWISYERLTEAPEATFAAVLDAFGIARDDACIAMATQAARFDRMAAMERAQGFPGGVTDDPDARRMREGRIGGGDRYLDDDDRRYVSQTLSETLTPAARERLQSLGCIL